MKKDDRFPLKRWLYLGTAAIKKNFSMAAWWSIIFFIACGVGYLI